MHTSDSFSRYDHTQRGPWFFVIQLVVVICFVPTIIDEGLGPWNYLFYGLCAFMELIAFGLLHLNVQDDDDRLEARFGPVRLPFFRTSIRYDEITSFEASRSNLKDQWGIHWTAKHGWIYNIWGYDCVKIMRGEKAVRIGTNDLPGLLALLTEKATESGEGDSP
jgi:hypothetical protein